MPTKITCCICGNKHQSARNSELCKNIKGDLPLFTDFLRENDRSIETSFARSQIAPNAIRRIMSFMHARKDDFRKWSKENPRAEIVADLIPTPFGKFKLPEIEARFSTSILPGLTAQLLNGISFDLQIPME
jgi:hypothetical protein